MDTKEALYQETPKAENSVVEISAECKRSTCKRMGVFVPKEFLPPPLRDAAVKAIRCFVHLDRDLKKPWLRAFFEYARQNNKLEHAALDGAIIRPPKGADRSVLSDFAFEHVLLRDTQLRRLDLRRSRFNGRELHSTKFIDCDLDSSTFQFRKFVNVMFQRCDLRNAQLGAPGSDARLEIKQCVFRNVVFSGSNISNTLFWNSDFDGCRFDGVKGKGPITFSGGRIRNSNLQNTQLIDRLKFEGEKPVRMERVRLPSSSYGRFRKLQQERKVALGEGVSFLHSDEADRTFAQAEEHISIERYPVRGTSVLVNRTALAIVFFTFLCSLGAHSAGFTPVYVNTIGVCAAVAGSIWAKFASRIHKTRTKQRVIVAVR